MDRGRFELPVSVHDATEQFRADTDPVAQFLAEETHLDAEGWTPRSEHYGDQFHGYRKWCTDSGRGPVAASKFYTRVKGLPGVAESKRRGVRGFAGLAIGALEDTGGHGGQVPSPSPVHTGERVEKLPPLPPADRLGDF